MNLFTLFKYIRYTLFSRHRTGHGIHSPFVFDLITRVFRNKTDVSIVFTVETLRQKLLSDKRKIVVDDYGSGSEKIKKSNIRKVSTVTNNSSVPKKYGKLLANMSREFGSSSVIELGTSMGISTLYLSLGNNQAKVFSIEGSPEISKIAKTNFTECNNQNITVLSGTFDEVLPDLLFEVKKPGLVFIDGNHRKEPVLKYFYQVVENSGENTVIIIDDINHSREMSDAWSAIKKHEKVSMTIDIFRMGMVFFRKRTTRQDFIIRY
jgi:predicted O-methyltransferase YrrM